MIPIWVGKMVAKRVIKVIKHRIDLKKIDDYANKPNELDIQMKVVQKTQGKYGRDIEEMQKDIAILKKDSHEKRDFVICESCKEKIKEK